MGRTVIVGDVHGCRRELEELLALVKFDAGDRLVFVGDVIARGPDSLGVLDVIRQTGALFVRGNHEERILASRETDPHHPLSWSSKGVKPKKPQSRLHADLARRLRPVDWALLKASKLYVDLPDHGLRVVHAGVVPGLAIEHQKRSTLLSIRTLGARGEPLERGGRALWGLRYQGPPHVVFGHNARPLPQLHPWATGLDTGCVYGGVLTAIVLDDGERVPHDVVARRKRLVTVRAAREYFTPGS
jgi:hypothetical protein